MSLAAWKPLADCEIAHELLKKEKRESLNWRVYWVACLALLRAVGHVLKKVDGETDKKHKDVVAQAWDEWNKKKEEHAIFWKFIEAERNNLLKQYEFGVAPEPIYVVDNAGNRIVTNAGEAVVIEAEYYRLSLTGLEDKEGRDVIDEAMAWWDEELKKIEGKLTKAESSGK